MTIMFVIDNDGASIVGDTETHLTAYSYPMSQTADDAKHFTKRFDAQARLLMLATDMLDAQRELNVDKATTSMAEIGGGSTTADRSPACREPGECDYRDRLRGGGRFGNYSRARACPVRRSGADASAAPSLNPGRAQERPPRRLRWL